MKTRYNNSRAFSRMLNRREMSGYQPRSLREEIGMILNRLKLDPAATRCDKATIER